MSTAWAVKSHHKGREVGWPGNEHIHTHMNFGMEYISESILHMHVHCPYARHPKVYCSQYSHPEYKNQFKLKSWLNAIEQCGNNNIELIRSLTYCIHKKLYRWNSRNSKETENNKCCRCRCPRAVTIHLHFYLFNLYNLMISDLEERERKRVKIVD